MAKPIPEGLSVLSSHLIVNDVNAAVEWYKKAFKATSSVCVNGPDGKMMHAEIDAFGGRFMLGAAMPDYNNFAPDHFKGTPVGMHFYVEDCDKIFEQVVDAGAEVLSPPEDMFWGDRFGKVKDPFGHEWAFATHKVDLTNEEIQKAGDKWMKEEMGKAKKAHTPA